MNNESNYLNSIDIKDFDVPVFLHLPNSKNIPVDMDKVNILRQKIRETLELGNVNIPDDIKISTMTLEGKFNTTFYPWHIFKYIKKSKDGIINVVKSNTKKKKKNKDDDFDVDEYGNIKEKNHEKEQETKQEKEQKAKVNPKPENKPGINRKTIKSRINSKKSKKGKQSKNRQSDMFLNQVTVCISVSNKDKPVSVKIFNNGTVHFTGCVTIDNLLEATYKLCNECRRDIAILENNKIKDIKFVEDPDVLRVENLFDNKVDMINCIFVAPFKIDRPKLQVLMKADGYNAAYDSNGHAGVKIKYASTGKKITIFVFESGSIIIILGKQGFSRINEIYTFIYKYLLENYESIVKEDDITTSVILDFLAKDKKEDEIRRLAIIEAEKILNESKQLAVMNHHIQSAQKRGRPKINKDYDDLVNIADIEQHNQKDNKKIKNLISTNTNNNLKKSRG